MTNTQGTASGPFNVNPQAPAHDPWQVPATNIMPVANPRTYQGAGDSVALAVARATAAAQALGLPLYIPTEYGGAPSLSNMNVTGAIPSGTYVTLGTTLVDVAAHGDDLVAAHSSQSSGVAYLLNKASYALSATITPRSGDRFIGVNPAGVTLTPGSGVTQLFAATIAGGGSLTDVEWRDLTLDGSSSPTGSVYLIHLDTSANANIIYDGIRITNCKFQNALVGYWHAGNNFDAGAMNNMVNIDGCRFYNLANGVLLNGTYGIRIGGGSRFYQCTITAIGTGNGFGNPAMGGSGPTTLLWIDNIHIEGLGNLTGAGSGSESGIGAAASQMMVTNVRMENISKHALWVESGEGEGSLIDGVQVWGTGGSLLFGDGTLGQTFMVSNLVGAYIQRNSAYNVFGAIALNGGDWQVSNVLIADAATNPPNVALALGQDSANSMGVVNVDNYRCDSAAVWTYSPDAQANMVLNITKSPGFNPQGYFGAGGPAGAPAVPASGLGSPYAYNYLNNGASGVYGAPATVYIQTGAGVTVSQIAIAGKGGGGSLFATGLTVPASGCVAVRLVPGEKIALTYAGGTPTWVWVLE